MNANLRPVGQRPPSSSRAAKPPPLALTPLLASSKNAMLHELDGLIAQYNRYFGLFASQREANPNFVVDAKVVRLLDALSLRVLAYLLYRPPAARKPRGRQKWDDVAALKDAIVAHADFFGIRFMKSDLRDPEGMNYWLERVGRSDGYDAFLKWAKRTDKTAFVDGSPWWNMTQLKTETERAHCEVKFMHGEVVDAEGDRVDTAQGVGAYSNLPRSWIYVCSAANHKIYSRPCEQGEFHHSSFLAGEPIIAGGDWVVSRGKLLFLNAASGHYRPTAGGLALFASLHRAGLPPDALIQPEYKGAIHLVRDFLALGPQAPVAPIPELLQLIGYLGYPGDPEDKLGEMMANIRPAQREAMVARFQRTGR